MQFMISKNNLKEIINLSKKFLFSSVVLEPDINFIVFIIRGNILHICSSTMNSKILFSTEIENVNNKNVVFSIDLLALDKLLNKIECETIAIEYINEKKTIKIYTTENKKSYVIFKSTIIPEICYSLYSGTDSIIPAIKTSDDVYDPETHYSFYSSGIEKNKLNEYIVTKSDLLISLNYMYTFLPDSPQFKNYSFILLNKGIMYTSNRINKIAIIKNNEYTDLKDFIIIKEAVPVYINFLSIIQEDKVKLIEKEKEYIIKRIDKDDYYSINKSEITSINSMNINSLYLDNSGPHVTVSKDELIKAIDRISSIYNLSFYSEIQIDLVINKENSYLEITSLPEKVAVEYVPCGPNGYESEKETFNRLIDYKLLKSTLSAIKDDSIRLYINKQDSEKFLKIAVENTNYVIIGIIAYNKKRGK